MGGQERHHEDLAFQLDFEGLDGFIRPRRGGAFQGLQGREAQLAAEGQQPHAQDQQRQLQWPGVRAQQPRQPAGPRDEEEAQQDAQGQGPDEGPPAAVAPAPVVTGRAKQRDRDQTQHRTDACKKGEECE